MLLADGFRPSSKSSAGIYAVHSSNLHELFLHICSKHINTTGADPGFQVRGGGRASALKKIAPSKGRHEKFGVFRVKNHDFTPKKSDFFQMQREARKFLGYFV